MRGKQLKVNILILGAFTLYCIFLAGPVSYMLESTPGESSLCNITLPRVTNDIYWSFDRFHASTRILDIEGWAYTDRESAAGAGAAAMADSLMFLVFTSSDMTYIFNTFSVPRPDVIDDVKKNDLHPLSPGYKALIPVKKIKAGDYDVGIYIKEGAGAALQYTDKVVSISNGIAVVLPRLAKPPTRYLIAETGDLILAIDSIKELEVNGKAVVEIAGWAFIQGRNAENSQIYVALSSSTADYVFDTMPQMRADITTAFAETGLKLDQCGFITKIPKASIHNGTYRLGIYIKRNNREALQYTDKSIVKSTDAVEARSVQTKRSKLTLPAESENMTINIDAQTDIEENGKALIEITGWAFINGQNAENSQIYVILSSGTTDYGFDTTPQKRPDVAAVYIKTGLNMNDSGFTARIPKEHIENGTYKLGIYIKKDTIDALQYTDKTILISPVVN